MQRLMLRHQIVSNLFAFVVAMQWPVAPAMGEPMDYELVEVGDPNNANDVIASGTATNYGAVSYDYLIGKCEVTIGQYAVFLNAVAKSDPNGLYDSQMETDLNSAGIGRSGENGAYSYSVINNGGVSGRRPISYVNAFNALRYCNWMSNGQPVGSQDSMTTENGTYAISGTSIQFSRNTTNPNTGLPPSFWLPTENEWYKAAYYSPLKSSGTSGYYAYATQSDSAPENLVGPAANQANYRLLTGTSLVYSVTQSTAFSPAQNYLTDVGAFSGSTSYYGTYDQAGGVYEWVVAGEDTASGGTASAFVLRGGGWNSGKYNISSANRVEINPRYYDIIGFRLAAPVAVPEPAAGFIVIGGIACLLGTRLMRKGFQRTKPLA